MRAEGWYRDPFRLHADRWFSAGRPTSLVRDGDVEGRDAPPADGYPTPLVEVTPRRPVDASDLLRADAAQGKGSVVDERQMREAAMDAAAWQSNI